jgi:hypothetical protein
VLTVYSNGWASFVQHAIFWRKPPNVRGHRPPASTSQPLAWASPPSPLLPCWFSHCHLRRTIGSTEEIAIVEGWV